MLERFEWLFYLFGALLVVTAFRMAFGQEASFNLEKNLVVRLLRTVVPITRRTHGDWFITRRRGLIVASPLLVALLTAVLHNVVSIRISSQEKRELEKITKTSAKSVSEVVREAIESWLARRRRLCFDG